MANTTPIETQTQCRRISLAPEPDLNQRLTALCDTMGAAGFLLSASFVIGTELVLVFQLTR
jgi:hypothetical protein